MDTRPLTSEMTDKQFIEAFEEGGFARDNFPHRGHLRMAWVYVQHLGLAAAVERAATGIRAMASRHGQASVYHDTLTRAWVYRVAAAAAATPELSDFDQFVSANPELLDKTELLRYYSPDVLSSQRARAGWVAPDLRPLPGAPPTLVESQPVAARSAVLAAEYHQALRHVPRPVAVLTARDATRVHAVTVSAVTSVSLAPPVLVVCVRRDSRILEIIRVARTFGVSYLADNQADLVTRFSDPAREGGTAQFSGVPHVVGSSGVPLVLGGPARFECELWRESPAGTHRILRGKVVGASSSSVPALQRLDGEWVA